MSSPDNEDLLADELLALAGEGSDSQPNSPQQHTRSPSPPADLPPSPPETKMKAQPQAQPQKGIARKMNKKTAATRPKLTVDLLEDDASSAPESPDSLGSGAMSESDDEDAAAPPTTAAQTSPNDGPRYPLEGKFLSQQDKEEIMGMSEARREAILSERMEEVERDTFNRQLRERHEAQQKEAARVSDRKKRTAAAADLDEPARKTGSKKAAVNERLEAYKKQREQKHEQRRKDDDRRAQGRSLSPRSSNERSDAGREGTSDVEWDNRPSNSSSAPMQEPSADRRALQRIVLGRTSLLQLAFTPGFEHSTKGAFVRAAVGPDPTGRGNLYRMCQITGYKPVKPYAIESMNGNWLQVDMNAITKFGKSEKILPFTNCSMSPLTDAEFQSYKEACERDGVRMPTLSFVAKKFAEMQTLADHRWTAAEISEKLRRSGGGRARIIKIEIEELRNRRADAEQRGDEAAVQQYDQKISKLQVPKPAPGLRIEAPRKPVVDDRIAKLNREIRKSNMRDLEEYRLAERREKAKREKDLREYREMSRQNALARAAKEAADREKAADSASPAGNPGADGKQTKSKPVRREFKTEEDIIGSFDIDIDVTI